MRSAKRLVQGLTSRTARVRASKKGVSILEMVIVMALVGLVIPLATNMLLSTMEDYATGTRLLQQHSDVASAYILLRSDFERARTITITQETALDLNETTANSATGVIRASKIQLDYNYNAVAPTPSAQLAAQTLSKSWEIVDAGVDDKMSFRVTNLAPSPPGPPTSGLIIKRLDTSLNNLAGSFMKDTRNTGLYYKASESKIWVKLLPLKTNKNVQENRNINQPVVYHFDCKYKDIVLN